MQGNQNIRTPSDCTTAMFKSHA